ncbi:hypothetical protein PsorP6_014531 [Peronosclerospora sorghi]|uniref:Uncharacterized protein n=1 Tax=Peronosclerospora sorghi TaxID=230839 RepID=A0ACC0VT29_9STRA|nr:hypothetical protein PsorP6_014531 [Peronosclerospora sorghi]
MHLNKRKEVLRLYRAILDTSRMFPHSNDKGQPWATILQQNARIEIEQNRYETDSETIAKRILFGWKCLQEVREKVSKSSKQITTDGMMEKQQELSKEDNTKES